MKKYLMKGCFYMGIGLILILAIRWMCISIATFLEAIFYIGASLCVILIGLKIRKKMKNESKNN